MSFGKRGAYSNAANKASSSRPRAEESGWSRGDPGWLGELGKMVIGAILAFGFFYAGTAYLQHLEGQRDASFGQEPHDVPLNKLRASSSQFAAALRAECPIPQPRSQVGLNGSFRQNVAYIFARELRDYVSFLDCAMREQRQRFCLSEERAQLVAQLQAFADLKGKFRYWRDQAPASRFDLIQEELQGTGKNSEKMKQVDAILDNKVKDGLNDLILAGYFLPKRDFASFFGSTMPREFKGQLIEPIAGRNPCK